MNMDFEIVRGVQFGFDIGGSAPAPSQQSTIYGNVSCIENVTGALADGAIYGTATREEET